MILLLQSVGFPILRPAFRPSFRKRENAETGKKLKYFNANSCIMGISASATLEEEQMRNGAFQHLLRVFCVLAAGVATVGCGQTRWAGSNVAVAAREETKRNPPQRIEIVRAFTDVTAQAGVAHLHHKPVFEAKVKNIEPWLASVGAAAAASDYDNDGDIDLYVTNSRKGFPNALYRNNAG
jgi:hypothetical protein